MQVSSHLRHKLHMRQDIPFEVYTGSDLNQLQATGGQAENRPLGDVVNGLPPTTGVVTAEGDLLHPAHELLSLAAVYQVQLSFLNRRLPSRGERPQEIDGLRVLTDVDEATCPRKCRPKAAYVHIAICTRALGLMNACSILSPLFSAQHELLHFTCRVLGQTTELDERWALEMRQVLTAESNDLGFGRTVI